ncbi:hypothetical protein Ppa06_45500 [Planomonospora parontospora subsp. parontospora]|uniref:DUF3071 domain-containing protein n=3 Tax=Planomonospora parontospora TaxID=58119 RepID=A0AA37F6P9_9ACTN|nr:hypothetical protein GCM10010126_51370 [Planomonospora parontospora]GII10752.1 hypothetical protein Ppa06_45500 [Planomonospora parontospora subsp. parontospora]
MTFLRRPGQARPAAPASAPAVPAVPAAAPAQDAAEDAAEDDRTRDAAQGAAGRDGAQQAAGRNGEDAAGAAAPPAEPPVPSPPSSRPSPPQALPGSCAKSATGPEIIGKNPSGTRIHCSARMSFNRTNRANVTGVTSMRALSGKAMFGHAGYGAGRQPAHARHSRVRGKIEHDDEGTRMQELRLVAVSEDGTYLVLATAGRGTRFTLPVDDRLRAAVRGNFSRLGQYEIEVESPLRPKEIQARIRAGETAEEIAATAGIPVERVRWFEGPVLQEREYMAQQAQRCTVRLPDATAPGPTLGELVTERLTRRGVPADEIDWDSAKREDNLWRIKLGFVWNGHTRHAEWLFDPRRRHITPHDDEAMRLSAGEYVEPAEDTTVTPFVPRVVSKLAPVPPLVPESLSQPPVSFPSVLRQEPPAVSPLTRPPAESELEPPQDEPEFPPVAADPPAEPAAAAAPPVAYERPPMPPLPEGFEAPPMLSVPPLRAPDPAASEPVAPPALPAVLREAAATASGAFPAVRTPAEPVAVTGETGPAELPPGPAAEVAGPGERAPSVVSGTLASEPVSSEPVAPAERTADAEPAAPERDAGDEPVKADLPVAPAAAGEALPGASSAAEASEEGTEEDTEEVGTAEPPIAVPAARVSADRPRGRVPVAPVKEPVREDAAQPVETAKPPVEKAADKPPADKPAEPPKPAPAPARPAKRGRGRRASVPTWDEIMFGARRPD